MPVLWYEVGVLKVAGIGSRSIHLSDVQISSVLPAATTKLLSGGAIGVDQCVRRFAREHEIPLPEFLPQYSRCGKAAPILRNQEMLQQAEPAIAFWDGESRGTKYCVSFCERFGIPVRLIMVPT